MPDLREKILTATARLVTEKGVRGVSFREVARRAGVSHQAPYHEFKNVVGIMRALAQQGFERLTRAMRVAASREDDALDALAAAGLAYVRFAESHAGHFRVMFSHSLLNADAQPVPAARPTYATVVELVEHAVEAGYGRGAPARELAPLCWSTVHGLAALVVEEAILDDGDQDVSEQVVDALSRLLR